MTPKRTSAAEPVAAPLRVVLVTMDSHLASAAERANRELGRSMLGLTLTVHAAGEWGADGFQQRLGAAWDAFMEPVTRARDPWLTVVHGQGARAVEKCYAALLDGTVPAAEGYVLSV